MLYQERKKIQLKKLQAANLPIATAETVGISIEVKEGQMPEAAEAAKNIKLEILKNVNKYLKIFTIPIKTKDKDGQLLYYKCINCDEALTGIFGSFAWGLRHGEGFCSICNYPGRGAHYIEHEGFKLSFNNVLQYHPSQLKRKKE